jgi:hypothetical protein
MAAEFQKLGTDAKDSKGKKFFFQNPAAFNELASITAVDKAQSVPYLKIWQVNQDGTPVFPDSRSKNQPDPTKTVSSVMITPPSFGETLSRYPERPPASIERVSVKNNFQLGGPILYREIQLDMVVHRPQLIFDETNRDYDHWSALILPGTMFAMTYGWQGTTQNGIMNGQGVDGDAQHAFTPGTTTILFVVTKYNFSIAPDGSIKFTVIAHENGDNVLNHISLLDIKQGAPDKSNKKKNKTVTGTASAQPTNSQSAAIAIKQLQNEWDSLTGEDAQKVGKMIPLQKILDKIFAPRIEAALTGICFSGVELYIGNFNKKVGKAKKEFGGDQLSDHSIGDFKIPVKWLKDRLGQLRSSGQQLTLLNFLMDLLSFLMSGDNWEGGLTSAEEKDLADRVQNDPTLKKDIEQAKILNDRQSPPEIKVKSVTATKDGKYTAKIYIVDMKQATVAIDTSDRLKPSTSRDDILKKLKDKGIPLVTFNNGLSYIETSQFSAEQDPQVLAVLISRAVDPNRHQVANVTHAAQADPSVDPRKLLYSSAIKGQVSMLGNFAFDSFQMVWLEFGVRRWDGTFYVFEKEDIVDRTGFISNVSFRSTGDDPLNTQGVLQENQNRDVK